MGLLGSISIEVKTAILGWIPFIAFWLFVLWQARQNLWRFRKPIMLILGIAATLVAAFIYLRPSPEDRAAYRAEIAAQQAAEQAQREEEFRNHQVILAKAEAEKIGKKKKQLPGKWWLLYESLRMQTYWEAKHQTVKAFVRVYPVTEVEGLPAPGFNILLDEFTVKRDDGTTNHSLSWKQIYPVRDALSEYIVPFVDDSEPRKTVLVVRGNSHVGN